MAPEESFPPAGRRLRLGVVGGGQGAFIGEVHAGGARLSNRWELVAGALSSDPEKAAASGRAWHLDPERSYADFRAMARAEGRREDGIEAVAITVPNALHAEVATAFMEEGIDVISDKPLTATLAEAEELAGVYRRTGVVYGVTYAYSAHVMARQAREMVRAGLLGDLRQVHVEFLQDWAMNLTDATDPVPWPPRPFRHRARARGGAGGPALCRGPEAAGGHGLRAGALEWGGAGYAPCQPGLCRRPGGITHPALGE
jgi:predicted dehydrogenase